MKRKFFCITAAVLTTISSLSQGLAATDKSTTQEQIDHQAIQKATTNCEQTLEKIGSDGIILQILKADCSRNEKLRANPQKYWKRSQALSAIPGINAGWTTTWVLGDKCSGLNDNQFATLVTRFKLFRGLKGVSDIEALLEASDEEYLALSDEKFTTVIERMKVLVELSGVSKSVIFIYAAKAEYLSLNDSQFKAVVNRIKVFTELGISDFDAFMRATDAKLVALTPSQSSVFLDCVKTRKSIDGLLSSCYQTASKAQ